MSGNILPALFAGALGALIAVVYVVDAWVPNRSKVGIQRAIRWQGMVIVLGGGGGPAILYAFVPNAGGTTILYFGVSFALCVLFALGAMCACAIITQHVELPVIDNPWPLALVGTSGAAFDVLHDGWNVFRTNLKSEAQDKQRRERYRVASFLLAHFDALCEIQRRPGDVDAFCSYVTKLLEGYLTKFLESESESELTNYRACVLLRVRDQDILTYLIGCAPRHTKFTNEPLSIKESLAGAALLDRSRIHRHPNGGSPFLVRPDRPYKSVACFGIPMKGHAVVQAVLSVDCMTAALGASKGSFHDTLLAGVAHMIGNAFCVLGVDEQRLVSWLENSGKGRG